MKGKNMPSERLDKIIASQLNISRKDARTGIRRGMARVNGETVKAPDFQVKPGEDIIEYAGEKLNYKKYIYIVMNKPAGVLSASEDRNRQTVTDLVPDGLKRKGLFPVYVQEKYHAVGEIARHPETGSPKECILAYDGAAQPDWTIDTPTLWKPWHSRKPEYALPYEAPTGAHDMYKAGEYMIWTDGKTYKCVQDTNFSPTEYAQAWEVV